MSNYAKLQETVKRKGALAYFYGLSVEDCPYTTMGKQGRKFRRIWLGGYVAARDFGIECASCGARLTRASGVYPTKDHLLCEQCGGKPTPVLKEDQDYARNS